jgi:hypothetical protein
LPIPGRAARRQLRTKVNFAALQQTRAMVSQLTGQLPQPPASQRHAGPCGAELADFLDGALTTNARDLPVGQTQATHLLGPGLDLPARLLRLAAIAARLRFAMIRPRPERRPSGWQLYLMALSCSTICMANCPARWWSLWPTSRRMG